jgi:NTP pyrophosphatase (non-canonical NTP hydrolase)
MNWQEYLPLAQKTLSTQFHCELKEQLYLHAVMGSLTEIEELLENYNFQNGELLLSVEKQGSVAEESADIFWYLSILFRELNLSLEDNPHKTTRIELNGFEILLKYLQINLKMLKTSLN